MSLFSRMASNAGFQKIRGIAGKVNVDELFGISRMLRARPGGLRGQANFLKSHFAGAGYRGPGGKAAAIGARGLHQAASIGTTVAIADYLNPWGFGWGD